MHFSAMTDAHSQYSSIICPRGIAARNHTCVRKPRRLATKIVGTLRDSFPNSSIISSLHLWHVFLESTVTDFDCSLWHSSKHICIHAVMPFFSMQICGVNFRKYCVPRATKRTTVWLSDDSWFTLILQSHHRWLLWVRRCVQHDNSNSFSHNCIKIKRVYVTGKKTSKYYIFGLLRQLLCFRLWRWLCFISNQWTTFNQIWG